MSARRAETAAAEHIAATAEHVAATAAAGDKSAIANANANASSAIADAGQSADEAAEELQRRIAAVADIALKQARASGASAAEVEVGQEQGMSVTVRNAAVETVEHNRDKGLSVTVYFGKRSGSARTTDFAPDAIRRSVESACAIAKLTEEDDCNGLADPALLAAEFPDLDLYHPWPLGMEEAMAIAADCEAAALAFDPRISNTEGATVASHQGVDLYANSNDFRGFHRSSRHSVSCQVIAGEGDAMQRDFWYDTARDAADLAPPRAIGAEAGRRTVQRLGAQKARTGEYPVLFHPTVARSILSHLVSAVSGGNLYRRASFLLDKAGAQLFPDNIRIHEQPHLRKSAGGAVFDGEGVRTAARDLVADGVLRGYVLDSYAARKLNLQTTANAGGVHNLEIAPTTEHGLAEFIAGMERGLVVTELIGFGVNTVTGDYSRGAFGFWVEGGAIRHPVQEFTIAGNLSDMFQRLTATGADTDHRSNLRAGSILIERMTVAGQ